VTTPISHSAIANDGLAARFVAGTLTGDDIERFDAHLLECSQCQAEVALAMRVRAVGRDALQDTSRAAGLAPNTRRWALPLVAIAAAAALLVWAPARGDRAALNAFGAVPTAPLYLGVAVRTGADSPVAAFDSAFEHAMRQYEAESWRDAHQSLHTLAERPDVGEALPAVRFFAGAAALMSDDAERAEREFAMLLALDDSPYHAEAHFYRAKALLRLGRGSEAARELRSIRDVELAPRAAALADSIEGLRTR
jgi:hypothetical protein